MNKLLELDNIVLNILQKANVPISENEVLKLVEAYGLSVSSSLLSTIIQSLETRGYDIKSIHTDNGVYYSLVRYSKHNIGQYYRVMGNVSTPLMLASDFHIGSKGFSEQAWNTLVKDIEEYSIRDIIICGDIIQGRGVYSLEAQDISLWNISDQIDEASRRLNELPKGVSKHVCIGNHEEKLKNIEVGLDCIKALVPKVANLKYYGHVAKLMVNNDYSLLFMHSAGGSTYSLSYRPQRMWDTLVERPNIFVIGHLHQMFAIPRPRFNVLIMPGTLQRESSWLINKGIVSQVGWMIIDEFKDSKQQIIFRVPEIY